MAKLTTTAELIDDRRLLLCLFMFIVTSSNTAALGDGLYEGPVDLSNHNLTALDQNSFVLESVSSETIYIALYHNDLETIEKDTFKQFPKLRKISMGHNPRFKFPADGSPMLTSSSLTDFVCEKCGIDQISRRSLCELPRLEYLVLANNSISRISQWSFEKNHHLKVIDLSSNRLRRIPPTLLTDLREIESLDLSFNSQLVLAEAKPFLISNVLEQLKCNGCGFTSLEKNMFSKLTNLKELQLHGNPVFQVQQQVALSRVIDLLVKLSTLKMRSTVVSQSNEENQTIKLKFESDGDCSVSFVRHVNLPQRIQDPDQLHNSNVGKIDYTVNCTHSWSLSY